MAVAARSSEQTRTPRRGVWMFAVAPIAVIALPVGAWMDAVRGEANVPFAMHAKGDALDRWVAAAARDTDRAPISGELRVGATGLDVTRPTLGREVDRVSTVASLLSADSLGNRE